MMEANELRIGNWVKERITMMQEIEPSVVVNEYYIQIASKHFCGTGYGFFPITLTPEILEKCGFEKSGLYWFIDSSTKKHLRVWEWGIIDVSYHTERLAGGYEENDLEITSLHQLQNLYFALTGEELKINLNVEAHQ